MEVESNQSNKTKPTTEMTSTNTNTNRRRHRKRNCCFITLAILILIIIIIIILAFTVFKAKRPITTVNSVQLRDLDLSIDIAKLQVLLNVTIQADITIRNPNRVGFKYESTSAILRYKGVDVGDAPIPAGAIGSRQTVPMNVTLTIMADRLLSNSGLYSDVISGTLPLTTYVQVSGVVRLVFKIHVKSTSICDLNIDVASRSLANQTCHYKTKL